MSFKVGDKVAFCDSQKNVYHGVVKTIAGNFYSVGDVNAVAPKGDVWIKQNLCFEAEEDHFIACIQESESLDERIRRIVQEEMCKSSNQ